MQFREYLLNEDSAYLNQKIGDILSILHATEEDKDGLGSRDISKDAQKVINQIKPILNAPKSPKDVKKALQKVAVALSKTMEDSNGDELLDIMSKSSKIIQNLLSDIGAPIQDLGTPPEAEVPQQDQDSALQPPVEPEKPQEPPVDPQQPQQPQPQQQPPVDPQQPQQVQQMPQQG